jgi:hypothetical protein
MVVPMVTIEGHDWKVYYSYTTEDGQRVRFLEFHCLQTYFQPMLQGPDFLGSTTNFLGVYSVMRAIKMIAVYGVLKYMPWFEEHFLD